MSKSKDFIRKPCIEEYVLLFGVEKGKEFFEQDSNNYYKERNKWLDDAAKKQGLVEDNEEYKWNLVDVTTEAPRKEYLRPDILYDTLHDDSTLGAVVRSMLGSSIVLDKNARIVMNSYFFIKLKLHVSKKAPELLLYRQSGTNENTAYYRFWGIDLYLSKHVSTDSWELHGYNKKGKFLIEKFYDGISLGEAVRAYDRITKESMLSRVKRFLGLKH